ncbi:MAG: hypothetical protein LUI05_03200 [Oscillospiraceae bacterium]|nr:hypothetical protein [Oscillospiraceae bacterium]
MYPFNFKVNAPRGKRLKLRLVYIILWTVILSAFAVGFFTVYVNCYNSMHTEPMTVCKFYKTDKSINLTLFNEDYVILHTTAG